MSDLIGKLPSANPSPRIVGGVIKWYEGDTFDLQLLLELLDQDGETVTVAADHRLELVFRNKRRETVHTMEFTEIENNCVTLDFNESVSAKFPKGEYTYDVILEGAERKTLANDAPLLVE